jgi:hypothetical protein
MKRAILFSVLVAAGFAAQAQRYIDPGRVQRVEPQYQTFRAPGYQCTPVAPANPMDNGGIGFGGAVVGEPINPQPHVECKAVVQQRITGYRVTYYDNRGRLRTAITRDHPGTHYYGQNRW